MNAVNLNHPKAISPLHLWKNYLSQNHSLVPKMLGTTDVDNLLRRLIHQFSRSVVSDSATPWTAAYQTSLSITNF